MLIDLHTHSSASDGTDAPAELIAAAATAGLSVVAITDHDTTSGWAEAAAALPEGMSLVRGMEMSCSGKGEDGRPVPMHLLAYLFDPSHTAFAAERERLRGERSRRIREMAQRMKDDGLQIDPDAIMAAVGPAAGRPHLARALVDAGVVETVADAFLGPLSTASRYYVEKVDTPLPDAVAMVSAAGGVSVVAHVRARTRGRILDLDQVRELAGSGGLGGIEVDHADHNDADKAVLRKLADELGLIVTGSSDYHGLNKTIPIGKFVTDPAQYDKLVARASGVPVLDGAA